MSTQHLMKGFTVEAKRFMDTQKARIEWMYSSFDKRKRRLPGGRISPAFDPRLIISSSRPAFVSLFVVPRVYYPPIIVSGGRQTHVGSPHPAKVNSPNRKRAVVFVRQGAFVSSAVRIVTELDHEETDHYSYPASVWEQFHTDT